MHAFIPLPGLGPAGLRPPCPPSLVIVPVRALELVLPASSALHVPVHRIFLTLMVSGWRDSRSGSDSDSITPSFGRGVTFRRRPPDAASPARLRQQHRQRRCRRRRNTGGAFAGHRGVQCWGGGWNRGRGAGRGRRLRGWRPAAVVGVTQPDNGRVRAGDHSSIQPKARRRPARPARRGMPASARNQPPPPMCAPY